MSCSVAHKSYMYQIVIMHNLHPISFYYALLFSYSSSSTSSSSSSSSFFLLFFSSFLCFNFFCDRAHHFIFLQNNTKPLGPRGEHSPGSVPLAADPAIGKLVRGGALFIRMKRIETIVDGIQQRLFQDIFRFQQVVTIVSATVISAHQLPAEETI